MIRLRENLDEDSPHTDVEHAGAEPRRSDSRSRKARGVPVTPACTGDELTFLNPTQVAEMWGISHDKVLEFIKTGELEAFNVASTRSRRPQFKIPLAALKHFQERRSGRDPTRSLPPPSRRRKHTPATPTRRTYF
jgi:hypothetical protein